MNGSYLTRNGVNLSRDTEAVGSTLNLDLPSLAYLTLT